MAEWWRHSGNMMATGVMMAASWRHVGGMVELVDAPIPIFFV